MFACSLLLNFESAASSTSASELNELHEQHQHQRYENDAMTMAARVCFPLRRDFTGGPCSTKKAAQQAAAERAVEWLFSLKH